MKKLLIASSALVAATGAASALDVSLTGEITVGADINIEASGFAGATWDAGFTLQASGESMGWTYGGTLEFGMYTANTSAGTNSMALGLTGATAYMGGDFMGKIAFTESCGNFVDNINDTAELDAADEVGSISGHCIEWTGLSLGGLELMAAMGVDTDALVLGVEYLDTSLGKLSAEYDLDSQNWDVEIGTVLGGTTVGVALDYNSAEDDYDYTIAASGAFGDFGYKLAYSPTALGSLDDANPAGGGDGAKQFKAEISYDCLSVGVGIDATALIEPDRLLGAGIEYDCDIHDGINVNATLDYLAANVAAATGGTAGWTGNIGATVSF